MKYILANMGKPVFFTLMVLFLFSGTAPGAEENKANTTGHVLIWEVTQKDRKGKLYLAGSIHAAPARLYPLDSTYDRVLQESSDIGFEIDSRAMEDLPRIVGQYAYFPSGKKLSSNASFMDFQKICAFLMKHNPAYTPETLERIRPWFLYTEIIQILLRRNPEFKQEYAMERAFLIHKGNRNTFALESAESQIRGIALVPDRETIRVVLHSIDRAAKADRELEQIILALQNGNTALLKTMVSDLQNKFPAFYQHLFVERNRAMAEKILSLLKEEKTCLILAGAAHFVGEQNILQLLRRHHCIIRQLKKTGIPGRITPLTTVKK